MSISDKLNAENFAEYFESLSLESAKEKAAGEQLRIVYPKQDELQIDIDSEEDYDKFHNMLGLLDVFFSGHVVTDAPSRGGGEGRHITVKVNRPLANIERIALQAVMGSDPRREFFSLVRHMLMQEDTPTLFFEKP